MNYPIDFQNDLGFTPIDNERLMLAAVAVLDAHETPHDVGMSIVITDDDAVRKMNLQYRGIDAPTDVLSFPAEMPDLGEDTFSTAGAYLGDLVIAYPYAKKQAENAGHDLTDSLVLLIIHGTLHLLGYDHDTPDNKAEMWSSQELALLALGIAREIVPALVDISPDTPHESD